MNLKNRLVAFHPIQLVGLIVYIGSFMLFMQFLSTNVFSQITEPIIYDQVISKKLSSLNQNIKIDEVDLVVQIVGNGGADIFASEVVAYLKKSFPPVDETKPIRLLPYVINNRITQGDQYNRMMKVIRPLLQFTWLENRVLPVLFKSDVPVVGFVYPNAMIISSTAMSTLDDAELEALAAHEVCHLIAHDIYDRAITSHDKRTLRIIELFCDAGSASIISSMGKKDPKKLISGLYNMLDVLKLVTGDDDRKGDHPTMAERKRLNNMLLTKFDTAMSKALKK